MLVAAFLRNGLGLLVPLAIACTIYLYLYPYFGGCAFPLPSRDAREALEATKRLHWPFNRTDADANSTADHVPTRLAPFRLLALGDPQLEGATSIPTEILGTFPHVTSIYERVTYQTEHWCFRERLRWIAHDIVDIFFEDIFYYLESWRKRLDHVGNDFYLAHIYRTMHWWTRPTHVSVLGDLLGSQWIEDEEFEKRGWRFWQRVFRGGERVPDEVAAWPAYEYDLAGMLDGSEEEQVWARRIINVAGNHDIGYAGDLTQERLERFERVFGKVNYELRFGIPLNDSAVLATIHDDERNPGSNRLEPEIRIVVLNDMNLDTPAKDTSLQDATYNFINTVIGTSAAVEYAGIFTLVLTHIPLYKPEGVCVDAPFFDFHGEEDGGGVKEQYLLSADASKGFLEGFFGMNKDPNAAGGGRGRKGLILNGHDHEGCDTWHFINQTNGTDPSERSWEVARWREAQARGLPNLTASGVPGRREITVRSMMGDFSGNAGLLSMWFNEETWEWEYEFANCRLGTQHFWWFVHSLDFGVVVVLLVYVVISLLEAVGVDVDARLLRFAPWWYQKSDDDYAVVQNGHVMIKG
ncbi:hypothetical protein BBK36DRAFT_1158498 [Trichoderma citrinoviride]|uniref:Calcineurin-like phosphoesterase domain-containing protein n=1 Tax=Trichoderma citrinoviride TaxID=58853 RepID=A0A2T4BEA8_9HYPO|nr:hypothetical protein BBK36DRAFT_1158498 [Trichoderma citrinoviride]PTB67670.1 hypothetical protein BBK36DRAFT_1158498 [Trichoderma citrinoviride]